MIEYRIIREEDAERYVRHMNVAGGESDFLSFGRGGFYQTAEKARAMIANVIASDNQAFFIAECEGNIIGILILAGTNMPRLRHVAELRMAVAKRFWGRGVAKRLMGLALEFFDRNVRLTRLTLEVSTQNARGISLYKQFGFVEEGVKKMGLRVDDSYHDLLMMAVTKDAFELTDECG